MSGKEKAGVRKEVDKMKKDLETAKATPEALRNSTFDRQIRDLEKAISRAESALSGVSAAGATTATDMKSLVSASVTVWDAKDVYERKMERTKLDQENIRAIINKESTWHEMSELLRQHNSFLELARVAGVALAMHPDPGIALAQDTGAAGGGAIRRK